MANGQKTIAWIYWDTFPEPPFASLREFESFKKCIVQKIFFSSFGTIVHSQNFLSRNISVILFQLER